MVTQKTFETHFAYHSQFSESNCLCRLPKPIERNDIMPSPNFEHAVFEAEEEDWDEIPEEVARQFENEEDTI